MRESRLNVGGKSVCDEQVTVRPAVINWTGGALWHSDQVGQPGHSRIGSKSARDVDQRRDESKD